MGKVDVDDDQILSSQLNDKILGRNWRKAKIFIKEAVKLSHITQKGYS